MLVKLTLRLTTKVARSPLSSARSSSAAARIASITSGRDSANSAVNSSAPSATPSRPFAIPSRGEARIDRAAVGCGVAAAAASRDEAPVLELDQVEDALIDPLGAHVLRVDAEPLGQRHAPLAKRGSDLLGARERVLGADVVSVRREPTEIGRAGLDQLDPPVAEVRRDLDADPGHHLTCVADEITEIVEGHRGSPVRLRLSRPGVCDGGAVEPSRGRANAAGSPGRRSRPARDRSSRGAERSSAGSPPGCGRAGR